MTNETQNNLVIFKYPLNQNQNLQFALTDPVLECSTYYENDKKRNVRMFQYSL